MSFLTAIRNSVNGTTNFFQKEVHGRWTFFATFLLVFGIIQLLTLILFLFAFAAIVDNTSFQIENLLNTAQTGQLQYIFQFISLYMLLFMTVMLKEAGGGKTNELNFGKLFQRIPYQTYIVYFIGVFVSLAGLIFFSSHIEEYFFYNIGGNLIQAPFYSEEMWYIVLLKNIAVFILRYLPAIVLGFYLIRMKERKWNWDFVKTKWQQVIAVLAIALMFAGLYAAIMELISRILMGTLALTLQNETIFMILGLGLTFVLASVYNGVLGCLVYFSVHTKEDESGEEQIGVKSDEIDILDQ